MEGADMGAVETILSGLAIAAIAGITVIAYRHPKGFEKLYVALAIVIASIVGAILSWNFSNHTAQIAISSISIESYYELRDKIEAKAVPVWVIGAFGVLYLYLMFLYYLPTILNEDDPEKKDEPKDD